MQVFSSASAARALLLCAGCAGAALIAGAAKAQSSYGDYPPPPRGYREDPPPPHRDAQFADPRYADPAYETYQAYLDDRDDPDRRRASARYPEPRYADPREEEAFRAWYDRYRGRAPRRSAREAEPPAAPPAAIASATSPVADFPAPVLPHQLVESASAYVAYMKKAGAIRAHFQSGASVAEALKAGAAYEPAQLQEGAIAYAALTALQEPAFVSGARQLLREGDNGQAFAAELAERPDAALNIAGADLAAARAASALHKHGVRLVSTGAEVKQAAYDVQHAAWSKAQVSDPDGRLAAAKAASSRRDELRDDAAPELTKAVASEPPGDGEGARSPVVVRGLAMAALAAIGQLHDGDASLRTLASEPRSADCLKMAKLNLFQCLSVARPHYEDIFCLGQHAMMDTGQCVVKAAGYTPAPTTVARAGAP